jgi:hypothetical protein
MIVVADSPEGYFAFEGDQPTGDLSSWRGDCPTEMPSFWEVVLVKKARAAGGDVQIQAAC